MTKILLNNHLRATLPDLSLPFEVCDEEGKIVGRFIPASEPSVDRKGPSLSREEIEFRKQNKGKVYTTAEVLAHLETL